MKDLTTYIYESYSKDDIIYYLQQIKSCIKKSNSDDPEKIKKDLEDSKYAAYIQDFEFVEVNKKLNDTIKQDFIADINVFFAMKWISSSIKDKTASYINSVINGNIDKNIHCEFKLINKEPIFYLYTV